MAERTANPTPDAGPADASRPLGVYVHFPWCLKKCPYCDFLSVAAARDAIPHRAYADAVLRELAARLPLLSARYQLQSVFFGGGTPSLWATEELGRVLDGVLGAFAGRRADDVEVTAECNPTSLDLEKARALLAVGVNRLSLGVQSLDAERLAFLGRLHDPQGGLTAARAALGGGTPRVSVDFIFGVAGQSPEQAAREAATLAELGTTHVSAYALTIESGTEFGARAKKGRLPLLDEALVADSFTAVDAALGAAGFEHYEISNFARQGHVSRHNLGYWRGHDYLGLGTGAWGTVTLARGRVRYRTTPSPERFQAATFAEPFREASDSCMVVEPIDAETALRERIMLGLRLAEGLDLTAAGRALGVDALPAERRTAIERELARRNLERDGDRLRIPKNKWLFADGIISQLL
ncbi:MAG TPA: radical SAM family heme chaperone HemW [Polyangiaceae bacterium]|nr:radical SAM family heme chaperone HemW [Polyangiaceae bacterium]